MFFALMQAGASWSRPKDNLFKLAAHMPSIVCCSSSQSFMEILLEGSGAGPSSLDTMHISSSSLSLSDLGRYSASTLLNSTAWGETMAYLFGAPLTQDLLLRPSAPISNFMALFILKAVCWLKRLCVIPTTASYTDRAMLPYCYVVIESVSIRCGGCRAPPALAFILYLLESYKIKPMQA